MNYWLVLAWLLVAFSSNAQSKFPDGIYLNVEQLKNRTPAFNIPLDIHFRNDKYHILSEADSLDYNYFHRNVIALSKNDSL